jgi:hypothetical protein
VRQKQAVAAAATHVQGSQHEQSPQTSTMVHRGTQQSNDKRSAKRKASCALAAIQQGQAAAAPKRSSRLRMMQVQQEQLLPED